MEPDAMETVTEQQQQWQSCDHMADCKILFFKQKAFALTLTTYALIY